MSDNQDNEDDKKSKEGLVVRKETLQDLAFPEITKLQLDDSFKQLVETMPEHKEMLTVIKENLPEIQRSSSMFYKTQSQFMDNMMTVSAPTPIRNLRQILAEMNKTREAIKEAHFKLKKREIELKQKQAEIEELIDRINSRQKNSKGKTWQIFKDKTESVDSLHEDKKDNLKIDMLGLEIQEIISQAESTKGYLSGAIRKLTNYSEQYNMIMESYKLKNFNEQDFEKEEERYHIMKAFEQALCAARTRHDRTIDEGNMIYLTQIGINGTGAQREITEYLRSEDNLLKGLDPNGKPLLDSNGIPIGPVEPTHRMYLRFLERMADKYQGSAEKFADIKGMKTTTQTALINKGDTRLLDNKKDSENEK